MQGFSPAADNNKSPILSILSNYLRDADRLFEIGSGSGQHAIYMAASVPTIRWQPSDCGSVLRLLTANIETYGTPNLSLPREFDLASLSKSEKIEVDCVYAANVMHIVSESLCENLIRWAGSALSQNGYLILYGPFTYNGQFTTRSNQDFDVWLKSRDPKSGVRSYEWVTALAAAAKLNLINDHVMPANNQCLVYQRT
jgi:cyclopropane fatty-acyl-phospholipid synthase-like methyltransferase